MRLGSASLRGRPERASAARLECHRRWRKRVVRKNRAAGNAGQPLFSIAHIVRSPARAASVSSNVICTARGCLREGRYYREGTGKRDGAWHAKEIYVRIRDERDFALDANRPR